MSNVRIQQVIGEVIGSDISAALIRQVVSEAIGSDVPVARIRQVITECALNQLTDPNVRVQQVIGECPVTDVQPTIRIQQIISEVVYSSTAPTRIYGGNFQDMAGNPISNGYITFRINMDGMTPLKIQVCAGIKITVPLDAFGNVLGDAYLWANSVLSADTSPSASIYYMTVYTASGEMAWDSQVVISYVDVFDLGVLVPTNT